MMFPPVVIFNVKKNLLNVVINLRLYRFPFGILIYNHLKKANAKLMLL